MERKKTADTAQVSRFMATARALECDEDKDRFEAALGKIASAKPKPVEKKKRASKKPKA